ncbi:MAG TPA: Crp/Fnr family transcriptional regulator [Phenylobacterium sp.]
MTAFDSQQIRNGLLRALPAGDLERLAPHLEPVELPFRMSLQIADAPVDAVYFPQSGICSVVMTSSGNRQIEVGLFGYDGVSGAFLATGVDRAPYECFVQGAGHGLRLDAGVFTAAMQQSEALRAVILRFAQVFTVQVAQTALANGQYTLEERLARWLLMCHDRADGDELIITHEFIGLMLGVRRAGVTVALQTLEGKQTIRSKRRRILVVSREKLEQAAAGSYGLPEAEYRRLIGPFRKL